MENWAEDISYCLPYISWLNYLPYVNLEFLHFLNDAEEVAFLRRIIKFHQKVLPFLAKKCSYSRLGSEAPSLIVQYNAFCSCVFAILGLSQERSVK